MKSEFMTARIDQLAEHPAQMRTLYQIEDMAALTLQVYSNDLDDWQPITATPDGKDGYYIISGHRRRMARLFAYGLSTWVSQPDSPASSDEQVDIELVKQFIGTLVEKYEYVDAAAEVLTQQYAAEEIDFVFFKGSAKEQILALQRANYGAVKPDMLGVAHSFQAALDAGATVAEIARNAGQTAAYVRNHLALNKLPQELAEQIADGNLAMSIGIAVASIKNERKRHGLAWFVLSNPLEQMTAKAIKDVAKKLDKWNGLQVPLTTSHQAQRNIARALTRLWHMVVDAYPVNSWGVIASFMYKGVNCKTPWVDAPALNLWFSAIGGQHYYRKEGVKWDSVVTNLMGQISCATCPVAKLPERQLISDLSPGQSGVTGMPCRSGGAGPCLHGLAPNDPFHVRVPWDWAEHEGIVKDSTGYVALSFDSLQTAWQAQAAQEDETASLDVVAQAALQAVSEAAVEADRVPEAAVEADREQGEPVQATSVQQAPVQADREPKTPLQADSEPETPLQATSVPEATVQAASVQKAPVQVASVPEAPITTMRKVIADYMVNHTTMNTDHTFATPCAKCQHKLTRSPVKDKTAPHCAWAGRWRELHFSKLEPMVGAAIPVCRQFAPRSSWAQLIPAHPQKAIMSRAWIKHQIQIAVNRSPKKTRHMCEFLTGRPMKSDEDYRHWFILRLAQEEPTLNDQQMWTLMVWVLAESARLDIWSLSKWQEPDHSRFQIPANRKNDYFIKVDEIDFHID